jgi:hypothetical protein
MARLHCEAHARMLDNGVCTGPAELDCRLESLSLPQRPGRTSVRPLARPVHGQDRTARGDRAWLAGSLALSAGSSGRVLASRSGARARWCSGDRITNSDRMTGGGGRADLAAMLDCHGCSLLARPLSFTPTRVHPAASYAFRMELPAAPRSTALRSSASGSGCPGGAVAMIATARPGRPPRACARYQGRSARRPTAGRWRPAADAGPSSSHTAGTGRPVRDGRRQGTAHPVHGEPGRGSQRGKGRPEVRLAGGMPGRHKVSDRRGNVGP